jgi:hypothetical protein
MAVWPFIPRDEFIEALEWRSDVITTYSAEPRIRLSNVPRKRFTFEHALSPRDYQRARMLMIGGAASEWTIPHWHERLTFSASSGAVSITVDTTAAEYAVGGVAVLWDDSETYEEVTVSSVGAGSIGVSALSRTYSGALVMPGSTGRCISGLEVSRTVDDYVSASTEWICWGGADLSNSGLYSTTYRTHPVIDDPAIIGSSAVKESITWPQGGIDTGIGEPFYDQMRSIPRVTVNAAWYYSAQSDAWALRGFLYSLYGKQKGVWVPEWTSGLSVQANITSAGTTITVLAVGLNTNHETGDIMIQTNAGAQHYFRFTSVAPSGSNEVLTLSAAAGVDIATSAIRRACLLRFARLAQDRVELFHRAPNHTGAAVELEQVAVV